MNTSIIADYNVDDASNSAAVYCDNYEPEDAPTTKGQWYLPALGELRNVIYTNYDKLEEGLLKRGRQYYESYPQGSYWSSSEQSGDYAWFVDADDGSIGYNDKDYRYQVNCVISFDWNDDEGISTFCGEEYKFAGKNK